MARYWEWGEGACESSLGLVSLLDAPTDLSEAQVFTSEVIDVGIRFGLYSGSTRPDVYTDVPKLSAEWDLGAESTCGLQDSSTFASWNEFP